jgi:hypothetical protein
MHFDSSTEELSNLQEEDGDGLARPAPAATARIGGFLQVVGGILPATRRARGRMADRLKPKKMASWWEEAMKKSRFSGFARYCSTSS